MENKLTENKIVKKSSEDRLFEQSIQKGSKILYENEFFRDFISLMHNIEFNDFYKKYFQNWSDIETMLFYMKLYKAIEYGYKTKYCVDIDPELMTFTLHKVMTTTALRKSAIKFLEILKTHLLLIKKYFVN